MKFLSYTLFLFPAFSFSQTNSETANGFFYGIRKLYIDGGPEWMTPILICLILGFAFAFERYLFLSKCDINQKKFLDELEKDLSANKLSEVHEKLRNQISPIVRLVSVALEKIQRNQDIAAVEKSIISQGGVEMVRLEKNLSWISLFIALSPMLGFFGTVVGMVKAFSDIEISGTVQATDMAGNIKIALITTLFGLFTAMVLQVCYNLVVNKIDSIVSKMEETSIWVVDYLESLHSNTTR